MDDRDDRAKRLDLKFNASTQRFSSESRALHHRRSASKADRELGWHPWTTSNYFDVKLDSRFKEHIKLKVAKANIVLNIASAKQHHWTRGLLDETTSILYKTAIEPILAYCLRRRNLLYFVVIFKSPKPYFWTTFGHPDGKLPMANSGPSGWVEQLSVQNWNFQ